MVDFLITCNSPTKNSRTKHCIVLDLDETLVHTFDRISNEQAEEIRRDPEYIKVRDRFYLIDISDPFTRKGEGHHLYMWGMLRPHLKEFLNFCFSYFQVVAIWTAGTKPYAKEIVSELSKHTIREPHIVYSKNECVDSSGRCSSKNLAKMISECNSSMNLSNTFMIDDIIDNFDHNPNNGVLIPPYRVSPTKVSILNDNDDNLMKLMNWFKREDVMNSKDIRELDKSTIFY